ncbi:MAG: hypothetical protein ROZ00_15115 [Denitratisoma sp.]|nr:hypothetical protein [Denitratisoma sp.]
MITLIPPRTKKWAVFPERERVLLFAHALEEKLFDYTVDSYKARALNVHTCVFEVGALANQVLRKRVNPGALIPTIEELISQMRSDPVLTKSEQERFTAYTDRLVAERANPEAAIAITGAMHIELDGFYWTRLLRTISEQVRKDNNSRSIDLLPIFSTSLKLVKSAFEGRSGHEEAVHGRADHRVPQAGGSRGGDQGSVQEAWL